MAIGASLIDNAISSIAYIPPVKLDEPDDGAYGWVVTQGDPALASAGRLDIQDGAPNFMSGLLVVGCTAGSFLYNFLAYGVGLRGHARTRPSRRCREGAGASRGAPPIPGPGPGRFSPGSTAPSSDR